MPEGFGGAFEGLCAPHTRMGKQRLGHLFTYFEDRVERIHGGLGHERNLHPSYLLAGLLVAQLHDILAVDFDSAGIGVDIAGQQPQDRLGKRGFAAAGFAQDHHGFVAAQVQADAVDGVQNALLRAEIETQVLDLQERLLGKGHYNSRNLGLKTLSKAKPTMAKPRPERSKSAAGSSTQ